MLITSKVMLFISSFPLPVPTLLNSNPISKRSIRIVKKLRQIVSGSAGICEACCATQNNMLYSGMEIRNIRHKGLRNLVEKNNSKGLQQDYIEKITDIMAFLIDIEDIDEVMDIQKFRPHRLTGNRAGSYSLHVSANWRITFGYDAGENELYDVDYEDYH